MIDYDYYAPTRIIFGKGRHEEIGRALAGYGLKKAFLVYGGGSVKRTGLYDRVTGSLKSAGVDFIELGGVKSNPTLKLVREGIERARAEHVDVMLAVGGGSVIDTCKGIAMGVAYQGDVWDLCDGTATATEALPVSVVLTIPGTGSETSRNVVLTNEETNEKLGAMQPCLRPLVSILDPTLCTTIPPRVAAPGIYDMLSHTMERYMSETSHADTILGVGEGVMRSILRNGPRVHEHPEDVDTWGDLMVAGDVSHNSITGFGLAADWTNHHIEEPMSGVYPQLAHGAGLSITTPAWMRYVYRRHLPLFVRFAVNVMGVRGDLREPESVALEGIEALEAWSRTMGLPLRWSEVGLADADFAAVARLACSYSADHTVGGLERLGAAQVEEIYRSVI